MLALGSSGNDSQGIIGEIWRKRHMRVADTVQCGHATACQVARPALGKAGPDGSAACLRCSKPLAGALQQTQWRTSS
jgi:hypothetical protein